MPPVEPIVETQAAAPTLDIRPAEDVGNGPAAGFEGAEAQIAPPRLGAVARSELLAVVEAEREKLFAYVAKAMGKGGTNILRSKEVRKFRGKMKERAREQGREDVDEAAGRREDELLATEKAWFAIAAKRDVYGAIKASVDTAIEKEARKIVEKALGGSTDLDALADRIITKAGNDHSRENLTVEVNRLFDMATRFAKAAKDVRVGKDDISNNSEHHAEFGTAGQQARIAEDVASQVTEDNVGQRVLDEVIEADSVDKGMGKFGKLLDRVLPSAGDQITVSVEFKIPIPESPAYIQFTLTGAAARGIDGAMTAGIPDLGTPSRLEVMGKIEFRAGFAALGLDAGGGVNFFTRAGADSTALALKALTYGAYRRVASLSETAGNFWALGPGSLKKAKKTRGLDESRSYQAEAWAAMLEEQAFEMGEGYSHVGGGLGGSMTAKAPGNLAEVGITAGVSAFHKYDKESLRESLGDSFAAPLPGLTPGDSDGRQAAQARRQAAKGAKGASYSYSVSYGVKIGGQSVSFSATVSGPVNFSSFGLEITAGLSLAGASGASALESRLVGLVPGILRGLKSLKDGVKNDDKAQTGGAAASLAQVIDSLEESSISKGLGDLYKVSASDSSFATEAEREAAGGLTDGIATSSSLTLAFLIGYDDGVTARFELRSGRKLEVGAEFANAGFKVSIESISRLAAVGYENGQWTGELIGERIGNVPDDISTRRQQRIDEQANARRDAQ